MQFVHNDLGLLNGGELVEVTLISPAIARAASIGTSAVMLHARRFVSRFLMRAIGMLLSTSVGTEAV